MKKNFFKLSFFFTMMIITVIVMSGRIFARQMLLETISLGGGGSVSYENESYSSSYANSRSLYQIEGTTCVTGTIDNYIDSYNSLKGKNIFNAQHLSDYYGYNCHAIASIGTNGTGFYSTSSVINDDDPIIQIVPKHLFVKEGTYSYIGTSYGFAIETVAYNSGIAVKDLRPYKKFQGDTPGYKTRVMLFDINRSNNDYKNTGNPLIEIDPLFCGEYVAVKEDTYETMTMALVKSTDTYGYVVCPKFSYQGLTYALGIPNAVNDYITNVSFAATLENMYAPNIDSPDYNPFLDNGLYFTGVTVNYHDEPQIVTSENQFDNVCSYIKTATSILKYIKYLPFPGSKTLGTVIGYIGTAAGYGSMLYGEDTQTIVDLSNVSGTYYPNGACDQSDDYGSPLRYLVAGGFMYEGDSIKQCNVNINQTDTISMNPTYVGANSTIYDEPATINYGFNFDWYDEFGRYILSINDVYSDNLFMDGDLYLNIQKSDYIAGGDAEFYSVYITTSGVYDIYSKNSQTCQMTLRRIQSVSNSETLSSTQVSTGKGINAKAGERYSLKVRCNVSQNVLLNFENQRLIQNNNINVAINGRDIIKYKFVAPVTGYYPIYTTGSIDTYMYLYNSSMSQLSYNDDGGVGTNSQISYNFVKGVTYYIGVRAYSSSAKGTSSLCVGDIPATAGDSIAVDVNNQEYTYLKYDLKAGQAYTFYFTTDKYYHINMELCNSSKNVIVNSTTGLYYRRTLTYKCVSSQTVYLRLKSDSTIINDYGITILSTITASPTYSTTNISITGNISSNQSITLVSNQKIGYSFQSSVAGTLYIYTSGSLDTSFDVVSGSASVDYLYNDQEDPINSGYDIVAAEMCVSFDANETITILVSAYNTGTTKLCYSFYR